MRGWDVEYLVTVGITSDDSMMFQTTGAAIAGLQSAAMGVPWLPVLSDGEVEFEIKDLEVAMTGDIDTEYNFQKFGLKDGFVLKVLLFMMAIWTLTLWLWVLCVQITRGLE